MTIGVIFIINSNYEASSAWMGRVYRQVRTKTIIQTYAIRIEKTDDAGDFLKRKCKNSAAIICFGDRKFINNIGLKPSLKKPLSNGGFDGRLI